ncbi:conserved hypothetical protein [Ricinus communis]|uniref:Uncharacterized protein n=1 Tax=Ricinus communis TaxID=3988 RepID=B9S9C3_RICCO|nr:conserved hypothetical protein [Ricinus communis]
MVCARGDIYPRHRHDLDRYGYFDLEEAVEKLGYNCWDILSFRLPDWRTSEGGDGMMNVFVEVGRVVEKTTVSNDKSVGGNGEKMKVNKMQKMNMQILTTTL